MRPSLSASMSLPAECLVLSVTSRSTTNLRSRRNSNENAPPPGIIRAFHPRPFRLYWRHNALLCLASLFLFIIHTTSKQTNQIKTVSDGIFFCYIEQLIHTINSIPFFCWRNSLTIQFLLTFFRWYKLPRSLYWFAH